MSDQLTPEDRVNAAQLLSGHYGNRELLRRLSELDPDHEFGALAAVTAAEISRLEAALSPQIYSSPAAADR